MLVTFITFPSRKKLILFSSTDTATTILPLHVTSTYRYLWLSYRFISVTWSFSRLRNIFIVSVVAWQKLFVYFYLPPGGIEADRRKHCESFFILFNFILPNCATNLSWNNWKSFPFLFCLPLESDFSEWTKCLHNICLTYHREEASFIKLKRLSSIQLQEENARRLSHSFCIMCKQQQQPSLFVCL